MARQFIDCILHPGGHWNRPHVPAVSDQVGNHPMLFPELHAFITTSE
jgi:hypothetical protein